MLKLDQRIAAGLAFATAAIAFGATGPAAGQSAGSYTSGSSYNPVQQAINRNSMNAAILRQATGGKHHATRRGIKATARPKTRR